MSLFSPAPRRVRTLGALHASLMTLLAACALGCADAAVAAPVEVGSPASQEASASLAVARCAPPANVDGALLTLDHDTQGAVHVAQSPRRIVSSDYTRWILWDRASGRPIARGALSGRARPDLVDDVLLTPTPAALELRSAEDASLVTSIPLAGHPVVPDEAILSPDARHVLALGPRDVRIWRCNGSLSVAHVAPGLLINRIHLGAEHVRLAFPTGRVETVSLADGAVRVAEGTFEGSVLRWFLDGSHFLTRVGEPASGTATVHVYDQEARLVQVLPWPQRHRSPGPSAGGDGTHVWVATERFLSEVPEGGARDTVAVYALGTPEPVLTFEGRPISNFERTAMYAFARSISPSEPLLLDLRAAAPRTREVPFWSTSFNLVTDSEGRTAFSSAGVVYTGALAAGSVPPRPLNCGSLRSVAGARDKVAIATSDRTTRIYDVTEAAPRLTAAIEDFQVESLALSEDGRRLFLQGERNAWDFGRIVRAYELTESGEPRGPTLSFTTSASPVSLASSSDGSVLAMSSCAFRSGGGSDCTGDVYREGRPIHPIPRSNKTTPQLSPSGTQLAVPQGVESWLPEAWTMLYEGPVAKGRLEGVSARAWLDDERLLVDLTPGDASAIVDLEGRRLATMPLQRGVPVRRAGVGRFQVSTRLFRSTDGALLWDLERDAMLQTTSALARFNVVAGDWFVLAQPGVIRAVPIAANAAWLARDADE